LTGEAGSKPSRKEAMSSKNDAAATLKPNPHPNA
jgi:hypothetical protein